jgi:NAD(P)H-hydrate epimerase
MDLINEEWVKLHVKHRNGIGHKKTFGHVLVIAGSEGKAGAAILCAKAALHGGCGMVTAMVPKEAVTVLLAQCPEIMYSNELCVQALDISVFDAIVIGPGFGFSETAKENLHFVLTNFKGPVVIDADALTLVANHLSFIKSNHILTPHPGEFSRLIGKIYEESKRIELATEFIKGCAAVLVLKGSGTLVAQEGEQILQNTTGNDGMATAGSGDVLAGLIASLCAQGYTPFLAAGIGVHMHGLAGDNAIKEASKASLTATEIIRQLGKVRLTD